MSHLSRCSWVFIQAGIKLGAALMRVKEVLRCISTLELVTKVALRK